MRNFSGLECFGIFVIGFFLGLVFITATDNYFKFNYFDLGEKFLLTEDYSKSEVISLEKTSFIDTYGMACIKNDEKCVVVVEINNKRLYDYLYEKGIECGVDMNETNNTLTSTQAGCITKVISELKII